ncbi:hypothetical protein EDD85DRAFT_845314 [Armillaria nabsnona]|nr:hypothetical protein EDD85DRAFT_845314 [Armillaria nabsnona]
MGCTVSTAVFLPFFLAFCFWGTVPASGIRRDLTGLSSWLSWRRGRRVVFRNERDLMPTHFFSGRSLLAFSLSLMARKSSRVVSPE